MYSALKTYKKQAVLEEIANGKADIVVGTHSLIQDKIKFNNLGLIITDEQHRFGVNQRANLRNKGNMPDVLYLSATPIPRTYALTIYGDMDISIIKTISQYTGLKFKKNISNTLIQTLITLTKTRINIRWKYICCE